MQLADYVERKCNGQSAAARPPRIPSFAAVPRASTARTARRLRQAGERRPVHLAWHCRRLVSTSHVSPLREATQRPPCPNSQQPFQ
jgi:hypothetical protein